MAKTADDEFLSWVLERLEPLGPLRSRAMFGGHGLWLDEGLGDELAEQGGTGAKGLFFALIANGQLYLKVDDDSRSTFEDEGLEAFRPFDDKPMTMNYYPVPEEALDDDAVLLEWANLGVGAALRAPRKPKRRSKRAKL